MTWFPSASRRRLPLTLTLPGSSHWSRPVLWTPVKRGEGTCPAGRGTERSRHIPFAPQAGRRWRQPDEGKPRSLNSRLDRPAHLPDDGDIRLVCASRLETKSDRARIGAFDR
ncbi:hypothetical protein EHI48_35605 [Rhizobium sp. WSM1325]|nr:hypothetical protein EHI48_35605 [Rhizobium leguminosarum]